MSLLDVQALKLSFAERVLFDGLDFTIEKHDRVGFVGSNGTGKTTLFKIIKNEILPDSGNIFIASGTKIGYMEQHVFADSDKTLYFEVLDVFSHLLEIEQRLFEIEKNFDDNPEDLDSLILSQHNLRERYEADGGLTYRARTRSMLLGLGFQEAELSLPVSNLSGGQKTRAMLAKLLLGGADLLLLDEPTNHLDIESCAFLESFLSSFSGSFIVISHDRYFLDRVTNKTLELSGAKTFMYNGNFSASRKEKEKRIEIQQHQFKNQMREIHRIEGIIEQQRRWNREKNIKTAESKQKQVDRLKSQLTEVEREDAKIDFSFKSAQNTGNDVLSLENVSFGYSSPLFTDVSLEIKKGDIVFLLGANGCGKTTLFNLINESLSPISGNIKRGAGVVAVKYDQNLEGLNPEKKVIDDIWDEFPRLTETELRSALAAFLFKGDDVFKEIKNLSGGEKARAALLKVILKKPNLLLLDEPTNHLDIASKEALEAALSEFSGTMFIISHDRYFINNFATRICYMEDKKVKVYNGNYDYFLEKHIKNESILPKKTENKTSSYKEERELRGKRRSLENKIQKCEDSISLLEDEIERLEGLLAECGADYVKAMEISKTIDEKKDENQSLYSLWEELSEELAKTE